MDNILKINYLNEYFFDKIKEFNWILQFVSKNLYLNFRKYKFEKKEILKIITVNKNILKWAINNLNYKINRDIEIFSIENQNLNVVKFLYENNYNFDEKSFNIAVIKGNFNIILYYHNINVPFYKDIYKTAANNGHLNILQFLHDNNYNVNLNKCFDISLFKGHYNIILYIEKYININFIIDQLHWQVCCCKGYVSILKILYKYFKDRYCIFYSIHNAIYCNQIEVIKYIEKIDHLKLYEMLNNESNINKFLKIMKFTKNQEICNLIKSYIKY